MQNVNIAASSSILVLRQLLDLAGCHAHFGHWAALSKEKICARQYLSSLDLQCQHNSPVQLQQGWVLCSELSGCAGRAMCTGLPMPSFQGRRVA